MATNTVLKEGEEGYGILVEKDAGFISPNSPLNASLIKEQSQNGKLDLSKPIYIYATLQKYGTENRNGRIYPENILKREVQKYMQIIKRNASFHELDHPECLRFDAEILTKNGWKLLKDISESEEVYTLNQVSNQIELQQITKKIDKPYTGKMIRLYGRNLDVTVTPNHKFWVVNKRTRLGKFVTAQAIHEKQVRSVGDYFIPKRGDWSGEEYETITLSGVPAHKLGKRCSKTLIQKYSEDLYVDAISFFGFMGLWLAEGSVKGSRGSTDYGYNVRIAQKKSSEIIRIRELLSKTPFDWKESETAGKVDFYCNDARLHAYLKPLGNSKTKYILQDLKQASPQLLSELFEWFQMGDGRVHGQKYKATEVFSTSKRLIDDLHEVLLKIGGSGNVREENRQHDRMIEDRLIEGKNCSNMYFLNVSSTEGVWLDSRTLQTEEVDYDDHVYCVEVPNHIFYFRENGKAAWTGNSSIISLKGGSPHRIVDLFWQGNALVGKLEILVSRGYRETGVISCDGDLVAHYLDYGMTLGISSRGVGSLKKVNGQNLVQSDFELICWDIVSSPSTPGSYLYWNKEDMQAYDEVLPNAEPELNTEPNSSQDMMSRLNKFLSR